MAYYFSACMCFKGAITIIRNVSYWNSYSSLNKNIGFSDTTLDIRSFESFLSELFFLLGIFNLFSHDWIILLNHDLILIFLTGKFGKDHGHKIVLIINTFLSCLELHLPVNHWIHIFNGKIHIESTDAIIYVIIP